MLSCFHRKFEFIFSHLFNVGRTYNTIVMHMVNVTEAHFHKLDLWKAVCALLHNISCNPKRRRGPAPDHVFFFCRLIYHPPNRIYDLGHHDGIKVDPLKFSGI